MNVTAKRLLTGGKKADITAEPALTEDGRGIVYLTVYESGRKAIYEVSAEDWARLNTAATEGQR